MSSVVAPSERQERWWRGGGGDEKGGKWWETEGEGRLSEDGNPGFQIVPHCLSIYQADLDQTWTGSEWAQLTFTWTYWWGACDTCDALFEAPAAVRNILSPPEGELSSSPRSPDGASGCKLFSNRSKVLINAAWGSNGKGGGWWAIQRGRKASAIALPWYSGSRFAGLRS